MLHVFVDRQHLARRRTQPPEAVNRRGFPFGWFAMPTNYANLRDSEGLRRTCVDRDTAYRPEVRNQSLPQGIAKQRALTDLTR